MVVLNMGKLLCPHNNCLFQGYLGDCLCEQCGLSVVGLEREGERLTAAKHREHSNTTTEESQPVSYDQQAMSCDSDCASCDSRDVSGARDWRTYLNQLLPSDLMLPFHVSIQLNVDNSRECLSKLSQLLSHLRSEFLIRDSSAHAPFTCNV